MSASVAGLIVGCVLAVPLSLVLNAAGLWLARRNGWM